MNVENAILNALKFGATLVNTEMIVWKMEQTRDCQIFFISLALPYGVCSADQKKKIKFLTLTEADFLHFQN